MIGVCDNIPCRGIDLPPLFIPDIANRYRALTGERCHEFFMGLWEFSNSAFTYVNAKYPPSFIANIIDIVNYRFESPANLQCYGDMIFDSFGVNYHSCRFIEGWNGLRIDGGVALDEAKNFCQNQYDLCASSSSSSSSSSS